MSLRALVYAYVLGGLTFIPFVILALCFYAVYTSVPVGDPDADKLVKGRLERESQLEEQEKEKGNEDSAASPATSSYDANDLPKHRKGWLTVRRSFQETAQDGSYVGLVRGFLDARSKDPKRSRPKDMWYVALKGKVLYLYEDENMKDCEAAIELGGHDVVIYPEGLLDGELFAKRNAICLKPRSAPPTIEMPSVTKEMMSVPDYTDKVLEKGGSAKQKQKDRERANELEKRQEEARQEALDPSTPWFIFVKSNVEMEDWYHALVHASDHPPNSSTLAPLQPVFQPSDMLHLVETLDEQPDVIPMRWLNALIGRIFFSFYRTQQLESYIIGRLMRKLSKIKRPAFLTDVSVREVSVGNKAPTFSKPMLKELTKEGDASLEVHLHYKGEVRITVDATATINLGARFKSYTVKLVLAAVLREIEGNLLIKVKRPPSNRIWYAFTQMPRMVLDVEPVVSDRQITWSMILSSIEARLKEVIQESVVLPNMDDIAFFESSRYSHRGGIWADASRHERSSELYPSVEEQTGDTQSTISVPMPERTSSLLSQTDPVNLERSHSAPIEPPSDEENAKDASTSAPLPRAQTISISSATSTTSAKRRTWFGTQRDEDETTLSGRESEDGSEVAQRGRSSSSSQPSQGKSSWPPSDNLEEPSDDVPQWLTSQDQTESTSSTRSISQHSRSSSSPPRDRDMTSDSEQTSTSAPSESLFAGFRSKSPGNASAKTQINSPTTNFFQTLKTRDKQAISNSAKEAMRKWGVNWGGLKKDAPAGNQDVTDSDSQKQPEPQIHRPRPNYAELRAAVAQRKGVSVEGLLSPGFTPSDPVAVPHNSKKEQTSSAASGHSAAAYSGSEPSPSTSPQPDKPVSDSLGQSRSVSPAVSVSSSPTRPRAMSHHSHTGTEGLLGPSVTPDENEHPTEPIRTQPPAPRAMVIPGIHASHRGEVMSMGYAPPTLPPADPKKPAAIQSVYRLWKNPTNQHNQPSDSSEPQMQTQTGFHGLDQDAPSTSSAPPAAPGVSSIQAVAPRAVPPPLPPRSGTTNAVQAMSEPPRHPPELARTSPPASAALQSIVSRDNSKRSSLEPFASPSGSPRGAKTETDAPVTKDDETGAKTNDSELPTVDVAAVGQDVPAKPKPPVLPPRRPQAAAA